MEKFKDLEEALIELKKKMTDEQAKNFIDGSLIRIHVEELKIKQLCESLGIKFESRKANKRK